MNHMVTFTVLVIWGISSIISPSEHSILYHSRSNQENVTHTRYFHQRDLIQETGYTSIGGAEEPKSGCRSNQRSARAGSHYDPEGRGDNGRCSYQKPGAKAVG